MRLSRFWNKEWADVGHNVLGLISTDVLDVTNVRAQTRIPSKMEDYPSSGTVADGVLDSEVV